MHQSVPGWSGFCNVAQSGQMIRPSSIGYLPVIPSSPTELSTVYTLLTRSLATADQLNQHDVVIVLDQAIYAKALDIVWKHPVQFQRIVLRMGAFHVACTFLAVIGKRFGDAGLRDILVESRVVGPAAVGSVLKGKHYNRALRCRKLLLDALFQVRWCACEDWFEQKGIVSDDTLKDALAAMRCELTKEKMISVGRHQHFTALFQLFVSFEESKGSITSRFWSSYTEMVSLLLRFIQATREGHWKQHLACIRKILPWMFAYDRHNYSRNLSYYWCTMMNLQSSHPEAYVNLLLESLLFSAAHVHLASWHLISPLSRQ